MKKVMIRTATNSHYPVYDRDGAVVGMKCSNKLPKTYWLAEIGASYKDRQRVPASTTGAWTQCDEAVCNRCTGAHRPGTRLG